MNFPNYPHKKDKIVINSIMYMNISIFSMKITLLLNNFTGEYEPSGVNIVLGIFNCNCIWIYVGENNQLL